MHNFFACRVLGVQLYIYYSIMTRLKQKRLSILAAMGEITALRQGSLIEQYVTRSERPSARSSSTGNHCQVTHDGDPSSNCC